MNIRTTLLILLPLVACAHGQELQFPGNAAIGLAEGENLLYGANYLFKLTTPPGWVVDTQSGKEHGIDAVFYPPGGSAEGSIAAYPRVWQKGTALSLSDVLAQDVVQYRQALPDAAYVEVPDLQISDGRTAKVRRFTAANGSMHELVAYIDEPLVVVVVVMRASDESTLAQLVPVFNALVQSYQAVLQGSAKEQQRW